ncbi:NAD(P)H-dependent FMN reductase [Larkinella arboricola]|uniref:NAD(P)H-dependent FMN reductase n=1 Tax=Larkinella arboricola TaxID=643671 RepID=A0A327X5I0_LARAB|nr:NAD(P)H-dependent oxidoreductase [Larkinella arboricola]RAJ98148.1 NAD(P)H-dependent FMN reductase [Larkinella arboricola]
MYNLKIINSTVRPSRKGPIITEWIAEVAHQHSEFNVEVLDLAQINLPMMNEPAHPRLKQYEHEHTKQWSAKIEEADAFIFITAEYDHSYPAPLKNALEYLVQEWGYKAAGIVSYGGVSAGTRAATSLKTDLIALKVVPLFEAVNIPFFDQFINDEAEFVPNESTQRAAQLMLTELVRWTKGMLVIRGKEI